MELSLVQLALTHLLAAKAGAWALRHKRDRSSNADHAHAQQSSKSLIPHATQHKNKRSNVKPHRSRHSAELSSSKSPLALPCRASNGPSSKAQQRAGRRGHVPPTAWMLAGHCSSVPAQLPWAGRKRDDQQAVQRQLEPSNQIAQRPSTLQQSTDSSSSSSSSSAPSSSEDQPSSQSNGAGTRDLLSWWIPDQIAAAEAREGWHLDDEPRPVPGRQHPGAFARPGAFAAGMWGAASRLFGGGGDGGDPAADDVADAAASGPRKATPHLVGPQALGAESGGPGTGAAAGISSSSGSGGTAAAAAAALTSAGGALGDLAERAVEVPVRSLRELNRAVTAGVSDFLASDSGRRLSEQMAAEMSTGALMAPVYLTEELVKARLKSLLRSHARWIATYLAVRVSLATAALHCTKDLMRRSVRNRGPRWLRGAVNFVCDIMLPTGFFGPLLGVTAGVLQLTGVGFIFHRGGTAGTASSSGGTGKDGSGGSGNSSGAGGSGSDVRRAGGRGGASGVRAASGATAAGDAVRALTLPILISPTPLSLLLLQPIQLQQQQLSPQQQQQPQQPPQQRGRPGSAAAGPQVGSKPTAAAKSAAPPPPVTAVVPSSGGGGHVFYTTDVWS